MGDYLIGEDSKLLPRALVLALVSCCKEGNNSTIWPTTLRACNWSLRCLTQWGLRLSVRSALVHFPYAAVRELVNGAAGPFGAQS